MHRNHSIACITGATSGIGAAFAKEFARQGYDLIITGRRQPEIQIIAEEIRLHYHINVEVMILELTDNIDVQKLISKIEKTDGLQILVNNAGFAKPGLFFEESMMLHEKIFWIHAETTMRLTHAAMLVMCKQNSGSIINISSIGAFFPMLKGSVYSASKAFIRLFTESIALELQGTAVKIQALCPGLTMTDFHRKMGFESEKIYSQRNFFKRPMSAETVVGISLKYLIKNRAICVPGLNNRIFVGICSLVTPKIRAKLSQWLLRL